MEKLKQVIEELHEGYLEDKEYFGLELMLIITKLELAADEIEQQLTRRSVNVKGSIKQSVIITGDSHVL